MLLQAHHKAKYALAFDFQTARRKDVDGRLHVQSSPISKSNVCPYFGYEIPGSVGLGLDAQKTYRLLRDPVELAKAAQSFNNIPLMGVHVITTAAEPNKEHIVGATGSNAVFNPPYLENSLVVWDEAAIAAIESGEQRELSSSYRYEADMTPGIYEGEPYDGRMTNIVGNHVALVEKGRAGADVFVSDSLPSELFSMPTKRSQVVAMRAALSTHLRPLLAVDGAIPQLNVLTREAKTPTQLAKDTKSMFPDKVDEAKLAAVLRTAFDESDMPDEKATDEETDEEKDERLEKEAELKREAAAKDKKAKDKKARDKKARDGETDEEKDERLKKEAALKEEAAENDDDEDDDDKKASDKHALDAAIKIASRNAVANANATRQAEREVSPLVGEIDVLGSAESVYRFALDSIGVDTQGIHASALPALVKMAKEQKAREANHIPRLAADAAAVQGVHDRIKMPVRKVI